MARNLYRFYLYAVLIAMLIFAAVGLGMLLQPLLAETPLRGMYGTAPSNAGIVQSLVFFIVSWLIAAILGGLHYWLIRRDMHSDPEAGNSGIRAFFLNMLELIAMPLGILFSAFLVISNIGHNDIDVTGSAALAIATLALVAVIELERRRAQAVSGLALVFQRLHFYGVQLFLLIELTFAWMGAVRNIVDDVAFGGINTGGQVSILPGMIAATLWIAFFWLGYGFVTRNDAFSRLRYVLHLASFAYGAAFILYGIERGIELALVSLLRVSLTQSDVLNNYDFTSPITFGLLVICVYIFWLRVAAGKQPSGNTVTFLTLEAITACLLAVPFWWGCGLVILSALESVFGGKVGPRDWATALALVITGVAYIAFHFDLQKRYAQNLSIAEGPLRGFVFVMLGGGVVTGGVGAAVALYALGTSLLGSPLDNWPHIARSGLSAFIVGAILVGIYLWTANRESLFVGKPKPIVATTSTSSSTETETQQVTVEGVLDELLAGKITRDEAATRIHALTKK